MAQWRALPFLLIEGKHGNHAVVPGAWGKDRQRDKPLSYGFRWRFGLMPTTRQAASSTKGLVSPAPSLFYRAPYLRV